MAKYFVTIRTVNDRYMLARVLWDVRWDYPRKALNYRGTWVERSVEYLSKKIRLDIWSIMPNHIHFLINASRESQEEELQEIRRRIDSFMRYTARREGGPLWQETYHIHVVQDREEYQVIRNYIKVNHIVWTADRYYRG